MGVCMPFIKSRYEKLINVSWELSSHNGLFDTTHELVYILSLRILKVHFSTLSFSNGFSI